MRTCIETMVKNEHLFIEEWVKYHLSLGFDDIFVVEDYGSESHSDILSKYSQVHLYKIEDLNLDINNKQKNTCSTQTRVMNYFF
jgi:hypothetical protein